MTADSSAEPPVRRLASRTVYRNNWMSVREDDIEFADGTRSIYGVVDKADYALIIAEEPGPDGSRFHLVDQYRYSIERRSLEFPMGGWPAGRTGTARELAQAELREETGLVVDPAMLRSLGVHRYLPAKQLALFGWEAGEIEVAGLRCNSTFRGRDGREVPELARFALLAWDEALGRVGKNMRRVLEGL